MPNNNDFWLDDMLDQCPGAEVPEGFAERLHQRLQHDDPGVAEVPCTGLADMPRTGLAPIWRLSFGKRLAQAGLTAAAALLLITGGYWLGAGEGSGFAVIEVDDGGDLAVSDIQEIFRNREILETWELATDDQLEFLFHQDDPELAEED